MRMANGTPEKTDPRIERDYQIFKRFQDLEKLYNERGIVDLKIDDARIEAGIILFTLIADCESEKVFDYNLDRLRVSHFEAEYFMMLALHPLYERHPKTANVWVKKFFAWQEKYRAAKNARSMEGGK